MHITVRVTSSLDRLCPVGTVGHAILFASYSGVRSESVEFFFPRSRRDQRHLYRGAQVNNEVPPARGPAAGRGCLRPAASIVPCARRECALLPTRRLARDPGKKCRLK